MPSDLLLYADPIEGGVVDLDDAVSFVESLLRVLTSSGDSTLRWETTSRQYYVSDLGVLPLISVSLDPAANFRLRAELPGNWLRKDRSLRMSAQLKRRLREIGWLSPSLSRLPMWQLTGSGLAKDPLAEDLVDTLQLFEDWELQDHCWALHRGISSGATSYEAVRPRLMRH